MASTSPLDDPHQTSIYIPFQESHTGDTESYTLFPDRELQNGYDLRFAAYKMAWSKCLQRVQELIHALHAPIVDRVTELVNSAYSDALPGLPYPEVPVISVTVYGASSSIFDEISDRLEAEGQDGLFDDTSGTHIVTHLFPQDCQTLASAMKTLILGFINKTDEELDFVKRKHASSLSAVDINLFRTWFDALCESRGTDNSTTRLVVILHDFEQFDPLVVQDLFEISSLVIPQLPLIFILSITSPPTPSYIHATYPRSALSRLQVRSCSFSTSQDVLHDILLKTFFDIDFNPDLTLGPGAIEFLVDFFGRHSPSLDGLVSILQLAHMKHFEEPLTVFLAGEKLAPKYLVTPDSTSFLDCVLARVQSSSAAPDHAAAWLVADVEELLGLLRTARLTFQKESKLLRVSFRVFLVIQNFMVSLGYKSEYTLPELMCMALRGRLGKVYKYICTLVKKLQANQLGELLSDLDDLFDSVPDQVRAAEKEIALRIKTACSVHGRHDNDQREAQDVAEKISDWLLDYFQRRFVTLEALLLWDIWYTGSTAFPSELFNPSLRASIFSGLMHPQDYCTLTPTDNNDVDDDDALWNLPDTSILFQRYLESGKMINVFDWFESFMVVLEAQKQHARKEEAATREALMQTPSLRKGKQRQVEEDPEETEEQLEKWRLEAQARFIRSLHELDHIGLIKHTGRKADHVVRTVFDIPG